MCIWWRDWNQPSDEGLHENNKRNMCVPKCAVFFSVPHDGDGEKYKTCSLGRGFRREKKIKTKCEQFERTKNIVEDCH